MKAFLFNFKDDKDLGEQRHDIEERKTLSEGKI